MNVIRAKTAWWLAIGLLAIGCKQGTPDVPPIPPDAKRYELRGVVVSVYPESREVVISHEAVSGLMEAMTMPFYVTSPEELRGIAPGDHVLGTLATWGGMDHARLENLRKIPADASR
jgi:hypothetical protein